MRLEEIRAKSPILSPVAAFDATPVAAIDAAARVMRRCDELARCSESPTGLTRTFLSPAMGQAHALVASWMREAAMTPRVDAMGNLSGYCAAHWDGDTPVFLLGSHLDTVPNAGKYDGMLGVLLAIETVASLSGARLPFALEVVGFSEEEGVRFRTPYLGSCALAGSFEAKWLDLRDQNGTTLREARRDFGLPAGWQAARCQRPIAGYFEAHIEQGPELESRGAPLGIVTAICGQSRVRVRFAGQAGHAGTLTMPRRRDALTAASEWILEVERLAQSLIGLKATVGALEVAPGTPNVVPGEVACSLDVRHTSDQMRQGAVATLLQIAGEIARRRAVDFEVVSQAAQNAVPMDENLRAHLQAACAWLSIEAPDIESGAGHDAAIMAQIAPCAMLFLRTPGGASHSPAERVLAADVALAWQAMRAFLGQISACEGKLLDS